MKSNPYDKLILILFLLVVGISFSMPAFAAQKNPGDSCTKGGKNGQIDCNLKCQKQNWIDNRVGNGQCNTQLQCAAFGDDGGDCVWNPGENCAGNTRYTCDGQCKKDKWINNHMNNGVCDQALNCDAFGYDDGDCGVDCYPDNDDDGYGDMYAPSTHVSGGCPAGYVQDNTDCYDYYSGANPAASEVCDFMDNNCNGEVDEGLGYHYYWDYDGDGYGYENDNGFDYCYYSLAQMNSWGYVVQTGDCAPTNPAIHPGAAEICGDGMDNDCDPGTPDTLGSTVYYEDGDGDGYGAGAATAPMCSAPAGYVANNSDCDDTDLAIHPGAAEICGDGMDNDCDPGTPDIGSTVYYEDGDGDGYGAGAATAPMCSKPAGYVANNSDCDDTDPAINPGATETCNGVDDNCVDGIDEGLPLSTYYEDHDGDGYGAGAGTAMCSAPAGYVANNSDCDDTDPAINPGATETCNGVDDNCVDGIDEGLLTTYYADVDVDGYGDPATTQDACSKPDGYVADNTDCDDTNPTVHPDAEEICDQVDNDCDTQVDEGLPIYTYYADADDDGYGDPADSVENCDQPVNYVSNNMDCNDNKNLIHPGAFDECGNNVDENCNGADRVCGETESVCLDLADIPLETQVESAPPLVMFLLDDSGSMNWDTLCPESNGRFRGSSSYSSREGYWKSQFAGYNGVYYDPDLDYSPWPDSASHTYDNADKDHPKTDPDGTDTLTLNDDFCTYLSSVNIKWAHYYAWSSTAQAPYLVNITGSDGSYAISYYKATCYGSGGSCVADHSYITTLTHDNTPPADVVTGLTPADERQNFANWYQYYRKRRLTALSSLAKVVTAVNGMAIGIHTINQGNDVDMIPPRWVDDDRGAILDDLYKVAASGGTPLRLGLKNVGKYYAGDYTDEDDHARSSPFDNSANGGQCQQAFTIMMTDGYYNGGSPSVGNTDGSDTDATTGDTAYDGTPFGDTYSNTLADVAMKYYENDLSGLNNNVPHNDADPAPFQHMVTYSISFGLEGTLTPSDYNCPAFYGLPNPEGSTCPAWPYVNTNDKHIDDLWHAAVNGRGKFLSAKNSQQLVYALSSILKDVSARAGVGASVAVNTRKLQEDTMIYQGSYNSAGWTGDLKAYTVSPADGTISDTPTWSAADKLDALADPVAVRNIYTMGVSGGTAFTAANLANLTTNERNALGTDTSARQTMINYLRGDTSNDRNHGGTMRVRIALLGDIIHAAPVHVGDYIYVGGNDGMLHAFDSTADATNGGQEKFAYIPSFAYENIAELSNPDYSHLYFVDNTPFIGLWKNGSTTSTLLIGGMGKGGKGYFCLDITSPSTFSASDVKWEYPNSSSSNAEINNMGYSFSKPAIVPIEVPIEVTNGDDKNDVVIFGNGYDSPNGKAVLYVIDPADGSLIRMIDTGYGNTTNDCNGLSTPVFIDPDNDGKANYAYAGDLRGNVWKFDLNGDVSGWHVAFENDNGDPMPLCQVRNADGIPQPITTRLEIRQHCKYAGYILLFATGKFNAPEDFNSGGEQGVYGIWDWSDEWVKATAEVNAEHDLHLTADISDKYLGAYNDPDVGGFSNVPTMPGDQSDQLTLLAQQAGSAQSFNGEMYRTSSDNAMSWFNIKRYLELVADNDLNSYGQNADEGQHLGWYFPLPNTGERVVADPILQRGYLLVVSLQPSSSMCSAGGESYFYALNYCTGSVPDTPLFDIDDNGIINEDDKINGNVPNSISLDDIYYTPVILVPPNEDDPLDFLIFGPNKTAQMKHQKLGIIFWRFLNID